MRKGKTSIKDVAERCGLSPTAVSQVLNNKSIRITEEKRALILQTAKELEYRPNLMSKSLVTQRSRMIGLLIPNIYDVFFSELSQFLISDFGKKGYTIVIGVTDKKVDMEEFYLYRFIDYGVEGVIIARAYDESDQSYTHLTGILKSYEIPYLSTDASPSSMDTPFQTVDHGGGARLALDHLMELGHSRIGILAGPRNIALTLSRLEAIRGIRSNALTISVEHGDFTIHAGYALLDTFLKDRVTAILSFNDMMSYGIYKRATELGLSIPRDFSIISFGNANINEVLNPPLTSIQLPIQHLSRSLTDVLIARIDNDATVKKNIYYEQQLVLRKSTAAPSK